MAAAVIVPLAGGRYGNVVMKKAAMITAAIAFGLAALAVLIPMMVDWGGGRTQLATLIRDATGHQAVLAGPVRVRLLPSPAVTANDISLTPAGANGPLLQVGRLRAKLSWGALFSGQIRPTHLLLEQPHLDLNNLPRRDSGGSDMPVDMDAAPSSTVIGIPAPASPSTSPSAPPAKQRPPHYRIDIKAGQITYRHGQAAPITLDAIDTSLDMGGPRGPFHAVGEAQLAGKAISFEMILDRIAPDRGSSASVGVRLPATDTLVEFNGMLSHLSDGTSLHGRITASSSDLGRTLTGRGMGNSDLATWGLALTHLSGGSALSLAADLTIANDEARATGLTLSLGATQASGRIEYALGSPAKLDADIRLSGANVDNWQSAWTTARAKAPPAKAAPAAPSSELGGKSAIGTPPSPSSSSPVPASLFATLALSADSLIWHGQKTGPISLTAALDQGEMMLTALSATLPGGTQMGGDGSFLQAAGETIFDGHLTLRSQTPRLLLAWAGLDESRLPATTGPAAMDGQIRVSPSAIVMDDGQWTINGIKARGHLSLAPGLGSRPDSLTLDIDAPRLGRFLAGLGLVNPNLPVFDWLDRLGTGSAHLTMDQDQGKNHWSGHVRGGGLDARMDANNTDTASGTTVTMQARHADMGQLLGQIIPGQSLAADLAGRDVQWDAKAVLTGQTAQIAAATLTIGQSRLDAQGQADWSGPHPTVTLRLTGNDLVLLPAKPVPPNAPRHGRAAPPPQPAPDAVEVTPTAAQPPAPPAISLDGLRAMDGQVDFRAQSISTPTMRLSSPQARLILQNGTARLEQAQAGLWGGTITLAGTVAPSPGGTAKATARLGIDGLDMAAIQTGGSGGLSITKGKLTAQADLTSQGHTLRDLITDGLSGTGTMTITDGILDGIDLPAINRGMTNLENLPAVLNTAKTALNAGQSPFSRLGGSFRADQGVITTRDLTLTAQGATATADATIDLPRWQSSATMALTLANAADAPLKLRLDGPPDHPRKTVDMASLQHYLMNQGLGRALKNGITIPLSPGKDEGRDGGGKGTGKAILRGLLRGLGGSQ